MNLSDRVKNKIQQSTKQKTDGMIVSNSQQERIAARVKAAVVQKNQGVTYKREEAVVPTVSAPPPAIDKGQNNGMISSGRNQAKEPQKRSLYDSFVKLSVPDKAMRMAETARAEAEAKQARETYEEYTAGAEYQQYLREQRVPYVAGKGAAMGQAGSYAPGIQAIQQTDEDPRQTKANELKAKADYYQNIARQKKDNQILMDDMEEFERWPVEDQEALKTYIINSNQEFYNPQGPQLNGAMYQASGLISKYGIGKIRQMAESYARLENEQNSQMLGKAAEAAAEGRPFWASVGSVGANALGNYTGILGYAGELAGRTGRYSTLDPNNAGQLPAVAAGSIRNKVTQKIQGENGGILQKAGATLYQAGMSAADNLARLVLGGGSGSLALAATGSFGQTMSDASRRGASPGQALALSTASSVFEVLTEKVSLDNLLSQAAGGKQTLKQVIKNAAKAGGVEITEEGMNFALNQIADNMIMGGNSEFNRMIGEFLAEGMSYAQAREEAGCMVMIEAAQIAINSGLSGGMMSGATSGYTNAMHAMADRQAQKQGKTQRQTESMILGDGEVEGLSLPTPGVILNTQDRVKQKFVEQAGRLSKATGRSIVFYTDDDAAVNGKFEDGVIYVNTRSGDALTQIVSHELTHSAEFADAYEDLSKAVFNRIEALGADIQTMRQQKIDLYAEHGVTLKSRNEVDQEIVADFVGQYLLTDEETILSVVKQNKTLGQRIVNWFEKLLAKLGNSKAEENQFIKNARNLWVKALEQSQNQQVQEEMNLDSYEDELDWSDPVSVRNWADDALSRGEITDEEYDGFLETADQMQIEQSGRENPKKKGRRHSFAGPNARTADINALQTARQLDEQGVANETIRQQTGWFKGMDGKWRFEVDDSGSHVTENVSNYMTLKELLPGAEILKQYPNLEDVSVVFQSLDPGVNASYDPRFDSIDVSYKLKNDPDGIRAAVLHEIQHVIQRWEGFTKGTNVRAWDRKIKAGFDSRKAADIRAQQEAEQKIQQMREEDPALYRDLMELDAMAPDLPRGKIDWDTLEQIEEDPPEWQAYDARRDELEEIYGDRMWDFNSALYDLQRISKRPARTAEELYWDTAGEIEARNVAGRRNLTAEERKNKPPILGGEDTVFAEGHTRNDQAIGRTADNRPFVTVENDILDGIPESEWAKTVTSNIREKFPDGVTIGRNNIVINQKSRRELTYSEYMHKIKKENMQVYSDKLRATDNIDEIIRATTEWVSEGLKHGRKDNIKDFARGHVLIRIGNQDYSAEVVVGTKENGSMLLYDILNLQQTKIAEKRSDANLTSESMNDSADRQFASDVGILPNDSETVKGQYSISATDKRGIASDLRSILNRGGDPAELRQYINSLEQGGGNAYQRGRNAEQNGARRIIQAARRSGISVEEYLRQNWEQYDVDGEWNADAREALDLERKGRRYSVSDTRELNEVERHAVELFGTTERFEEAGFILPDGRLLRMTDDLHDGGRYFDHRAIAMAYGRDVDLETNHGFNADNGEYLDKFVEAGSIRFDAGEPDLDMDIGLQLSSAVPLTKAQERTIRDLVEWKENRETDFEANLTEENFLYSGPLDIRIDFGANSNYAVGAASTKDLTAWGKKNLEYKGRKISASQIIHDVRRFYETGETTQRSNLNQFRYSISETGEETGEKKNAQQIREEMPEKAKSFLAGAERRLLNDLGGVLGVTKFQNREKLQGIVREIADEYLEQGRVREERMDFLFDQAYAEGIVEDASMVQQYGEIRNHLRTTGVTLSKQDQSDIADFQDFRKRAVGTVRIVNNGLPVDSAYHELQEMAPELFPESITHPADQLVRMYEVGQSIRVSEKTLRQFQGSEAENYRKCARNDFDDVINSTVADLRSVREVAEEAEQKRAEKAAAPTTPEEAKEAYKQLKDARKTYKKVLAKNLLTESNEIQVGRLLREEILPEHLDPDKDNIRAITAVYEAKKDYERLTKQIAEYKKTIRAERMKKADAMLETAGDWKDKKVGIAYSRETMERNVYDIVPDKVVAEQVNETYFRPVHEAEAMATRFKNQHRDLVRDMNLSRKVQKGNLVSEAHAVQLLGEAEDNIRVLQNSRGRMKQRDGKTLAEWQNVIDEMWVQSPGLDEQKIRGAVSEFRKIYDQLFQQMNEVRIRNGYEPVNYRQGYFPHFQPGDGDGILTHFGKIMGIDTQVAALPTTINGLTHTFKPGIQWFGNAQERLGFNTAYDAVEGFDKYIEGVASVIYQTDNIQNLRALESQIRYRTTDEGIRKQVDAVNNDSRLTEEEKQIKINAIYEHGRYTLSNFVIELNEYTNLLANKKSKLDRTTEALIGRRAYTIMKNWESRVGANMIAGNISSALTNFIPLTQAGAQLSSDAMLKGIWNTLKAMKEDDGITGQSTFLTNRRGSDPLVKTWAQTASEKLGMSFLMDLVDGFTSDSIVRAAYYQNLKKGLSQAEAMHQADIFASSVMADRSKGAMPTLFESTNPVLKMFTQFQLEVNNQFSEIFKDLPRRFREKGLIVMGGVLMKYFIGAFLFNELYEFFAGRRPALDPISMLNDTVGDLTGYEMPNVIEWISGGDVSFETEKVDAAEAVKNLAGSALSELPFSSGLTFFGLETDGGRLPAASAIVDISTIIDVAGKEDWSPEKRWKELSDELGKLMYVIPPFGGNQAQKLWKGVKAYLEGGSYSVDKEGNDILQYPVYKDSPEDAFWNLVRSAFLGKSSLPEAQDWVDSGFDSLGAKQTAVYQDLVEAGEGDREAFRVLQELQLAAKTEDSSKATVQRKMLRESGLSGDAKAIVYYGLYASDAERELMDRLADSGADMGVSLDVIMGIKDINADDSMKGAAASNAKRDLIANAALTDEEKKMLYRKFVSDSRDDDIALFEDAGLGFDEFLKAHSAYTTINEGSGKASQKALDFAKWVSDQDYSVKQESLVRETFSYYSMVPADAAKYDKLMDAGLDSEDAYELASDMAELEPEAGTDAVSDLQRWRVCVDAFSNEMFQLSSLCGYMTADQYEKVERAYSFGVKPKSYVTMKEKLPQYDSDHNGTITQAEAQAAIDSMRISNDQKAVLWQLATGAKSAKNNPYNKDLGQKVLDAKK